jgi:hypothetical protein
MRVEDEVPLDYYLPCEKDSSALDLKLYSCLHAMMQQSNHKIRSAPNA